VRVVAFTGCLLLASLAHAQSASGKPGLWDVTTHRTSVVSPKVAERLSERGIPMPPAGDVHVRVCMTAEKMKQELDRIQNVPAGCASTHRSESSNRITAGLRCDPTPAMRVEVEYDFSWAKANKRELTTKIVMSYPGVEGTAESSTRMVSRFVSADCGSVAPDTSVPIHP